MFSGRVDTEVDIFYMLWMQDTLMIPGQNDYWEMCNIEQSESIKYLIVNSNAIIKGLKQGKPLFGHTYNEKYVNDMESIIKNRSLALIHTKHEHPIIRNLAIFIVKTGF